MPQTATGIYIYASDCDGHKDKAAIMDYLKVYGSVVYHAINKTIYNPCRYQNVVILKTGTSMSVLNADAHPNDIHRLPVSVVTSEIAQILSLYGGGFLALKWKS